MIEVDNTLISRNRPIQARKPARPTPWPMAWHGKGLYFPCMDGVDLSGIVPWKVAPCS
ncbi:hypothetical protein PAXRUDRAFT_827277, partial [Paxillus rubicundulus Ve08.2h10]